MKVTAEDIDALLPQTQCQQCGYAACLPYAKAIVAGETDIAQCAPGGIKTLEALAKVMAIEAEPYRAIVSERYRSPSVAVIDEDYCIGCMKCIKACPVDAIVGSSKTMHTVLPDICTGCELCVLPCPTDCIRMVATQALETPETLAAKARTHYQQKNKRLQQKEKKIEAPLSITAQQDYIAKAKERVLAKKKERDHGCD